MASVGKVSAGFGYGVSSRRCERRVSRVTSSKSRPALFLTPASRIF